MDAAPLAWALAGAVGALCGFVPGLHPNLAAAVALAAPGLGPAWGPLLLALAAGHLCGALAAGHLHGAADPDASALPPGGREAAELAALGAFFGLVVALPVAVAARYALGAPGDAFAWIRRWQAWLVIAVALGACLVERPRPRGPLAALVVVLACGALGVVAFELGAAGPLGVPASPLLPLLAGMFAVPGILAAAKRSRRVPLAPAAPSPGSVARCAGAGALAGSILGLLPGVTAGHALVLGRRAARDLDESRLLQGAVAGAGLAFAAMVALALGPARSGALASAVVLDPAADWHGVAPSPRALAWAAATLAGAGAGCLVTLAAVPRVARAWRALPRRALAATLLLFLAGVVVMLNGAMGLAVLAVAACAGHLATAFGVSRVHGMGVVLVPVAWRLLG